MNQQTQDVETPVTQIKKLQRELKSKLREIEKLKHNFVDSKREIEQLELERDQSDESVAELKKENKRLVGANKNLSGDLRLFQQREKELKTLAHINDELITRQKNLTKEQDDLTKQHENEKRQLELQVGFLTKITQRLEKQASETQIVKDQSKAQERTLREIEFKNTDLRNQNNEKYKRITELLEVNKQQNHQAEVSLSTCKSELNECSSKLEDCENRLQDVGEQGGPDDLSYAMQEDVKCIDLNDDEFKDLVKQYAAIYAAAISESQEIPDFIHFFKNYSDDKVEKIMLQLKQYNYDNDLIEDYLRHFLEQHIVANVYEESNVLQPPAKITKLKEENQRLLAELEEYQAKASIEIGKKEEHKLMEENLRRTENESIQNRILQMKHRDTEDKVKLAQLEEEREYLQQQVSALSAQAHTAQTSSQELEICMEKTISENELSKQKLSELVITVSEATKNALKDLQIVNEDLKRESENVNRKLGENENLLREFNTMPLTLESTFQHKKILTDRVKQLQHSNTKLQDSNTKWKQACEQNRKSSEALLDEHKKTVIELEESLNTNKTNRRTIGDLTHRIMTLENQSLNSTHEAAEEKLNRFERDLETCLHKSKTLETHVTQLEQQHEDLQQKVVKYEQQEIALSAQAHTAEESSHNLEIRVKETIRENVQLRNEMRIQDEKIQKWIIKDQLEAQRRQRRQDDELELLKTCNQNFFQLQTQTEAQAKAYETLKQELEEARQQNNDLKTKLNECIDEMSLKLEQQDEMSLKLKQFKAQKLEAVIRADKLVDELFLLKKDADEEESKITKCHEEAKIQSEVIALQKQDLKALQFENNDLKTKLNECIGEMSLKLKQFQEHVAQQDNAKLQMDQVENVAKAIEDLDHLIDSMIQYYRRI